MEHAEEMVEFVNERVSRCGSTVDALMFTLLCHRPHEAKLVSDI